MGGSGSGRQDDDADPSVGAVPVGDSGRLRAAEVVALKLGELLEELLEDMRSLPRWRPAAAKRREIERAMTVGLTLFHAWRDAFEVWPEQAGNGGA